MSSSTITPAATVAEREGLVTRARRRVAGVLVTLALFVGVPVSMASAAPAIDPAGAATGLVNVAGPQYIDTIVEVLPVLIPLMLALAALGFVWAKVTGIKFGGKK